MPLSKAKNRERMRLARLVQPKPVHLVQPNESQIEGPKAVQPRVLDLGVVQPNETKLASVQPIPIYNPSIHRAGDTVMVQRGKRLIQTTIPELDADGQVVWS